MKVLRDRTTALQTERTRNEARMRQPQNSAVLDRSKFLNQVFASKSFSWTAVMMDLERVLPSGVQVTSIEPNITPEGDVNIRLHVSGERDQAIQLVRNLERSQRFLHSRLVAEVVKAAETKGQGAIVQNPSGPPQVEFEIVSGYNPLPTAAEKAAEKQAARQSADTEVAK
jgi:type IV pilus assembly protein PilN